MSSTLSPTELFLNGNTFAGTGSGNVWSGGQRGSIVSVTGGAIPLTSGNNFRITPTGAVTLSAVGIASSEGQSGTIMLYNTAGASISKASTVKTDSKFLSTVSAAGTYRISYFCDGTNLYLTTSGGMV